MGGCWKGIGAALQEGHFVPDVGPVSGRKRFSPNFQGAARGRESSCANLRSISRQKLERVNPIVAKKAWDTPQHAKRFDGARRFGLAHVCCLPAELIENPTHGRLRRFVVTADKHGWLPTLELRVHHAGITYRTECLDKVSVGESLLQALHQRLIKIGEELQHPIDGRSIGDRIGRIDNRLAGEIAFAGQFKRFVCRRPLDRTF
jgi:hypothetical protein